jgi:two-component system cell cycle sensor histidine kinase/response regulator CckA
MRRVLVVDDKIENLYYLSALLEGHGYEVATAQHGAEALAKARVAPPDLLVSDLLMPVMDGYTLLRHWKADPKLRGVPFIVYTATYTEPEDEKLAINLGADAFILKPAEPDDFLSRVREVEARHGAVAIPTYLPDVGEGDSGHLKEYSESLIRKLEEKSLQLEQANQALQQDLEARLKIEATLRDAESRFRQLAENIDDVFWLSSVDKSRFFYVSPAYEVIFGRTCESLYARSATWAESVHPGDRERIARSMPRQALGGWDEVYRVVRPDGQVRWIRGRAFPVRDEAGEVYRIAGVSRDITEHRRLEEQFHQAQKMEAVGRLAGGVAHDFNNLLSVILGYAALITEDLPQGSALAADVTELRRAGERAAALTSQLLAFSRLQVLQPEAVDLGSVVSGMDKMLGRLIGEDIDLVMNATPGAMVYADPHQVEQVVMNLAVNARDAMPNGGTLTIDVQGASVGEEEGSDPGGLSAGAYVRLTVTDTGMGMDGPTRERIFEPFFTTKETGKGTGLGLATVYGIVKQSKGHIGVVSEPGLGTSFQVHLPRTDRVGQPVASPEAADRLDGNETILLVEDDEQVRVMTRTFLKKRGYVVLDAQNGGEAFLVCEKYGGRIDLLLTDVVMPRMSGKELADRLAPMRPAMKVLFVSGYAGDTIVHHGVLDPGVVFLQKPVPPEVLLRKVREILDASR